MAVKISAPNLMLPWSSSKDDDRRFWKILILLFIPALLISVIIPFIHVPEPDRKELEKLPPQLARVIIEKKEIPLPPPKKEKKKEPKKEKKQEEKKEVKPKEKPPEKKREKQPPPKKVKPKENPPAAKVELAKEQAQAEINEFADALVDLRDDFDLSDLDTAVKPTQGTGKAAKVERKVIASAASRSTGGISNSNLARNTGGKALSGKTSTKVKSKIASSSGVARKAQADAASKGKKFAKRSSEEIRKVMDTTKARVDAIYNRALRKNPVLEGNFKFEMVIEPNGSVSSVRIISSELDDKALEAKLLARIRSIKFGAKNVGRTTVEYDYTFLPS